MPAGVHVGLGVRTSHDAVRTTLIHEVERLLNIGDESQDRPPHCLAPA